MNKHYNILNRGSKIAAWALTLVVSVLFSGSAWAGHCEGYFNKDSYKGAEIKLWTNYSNGSKDSEESVYIRHNNEYEENCGKNLGTISSLWIADNVVYLKKTRKWDDWGDKTFDFDAVELQWEIKKGVEQIYALNYVLDYYGDGDCDDPNYAHFYCLHYHKENMGIDVLSYIDDPGDYSLQMRFHTKGKCSEGDGAKTDYWYKHTDNEDFYVTFTNPGFILEDHTFSTKRINSSAETYTYNFNSYGWTPAYVSITDGDGAITFEDGTTAEKAVSISSNSGSINIKFNYTSGGNHTAKLHFRGVVNGQTYTEDADLEGNVTVSPEVVEGSKPVVTSTTATLGGYLKFYDCVSGLYNYGFYYKEGSTFNVSDTASVVKKYQSSTQELKTAYSWTDQITGLKPNTTYYYRPYVGKKTSPYTVYVSSSVYNFTTPECDPAVGDTIYYTIRQGANVDKCNLIFPTIASAVADLKTRTSEGWISTDASTKYKLLKEIQFRIEAGTYDAVAAGGIVEVKEINKWDSSNEYTPVHRLTLKGVGNHVIHGLDLRLSRYITLDNVRIERTTTTKSFDKSALIIGRGSCGNADAVGEMTNTDIVIKNSYIDAEGFCVIHVDGCDGLYFENSNFDATVPEYESSDDLCDAAHWGASVKFMNVKNAKLLRNNFRGSHASNFIIQGSQNILIMNNVFWNDNQVIEAYPYMAFIRLLSMQDDDAHNMTNIGIYYNTFYIKDEGCESNCPTYAFDFFRLGGESSTCTDGQAGATGRYIAASTEFMYNNCYSLSPNVTGKRSNTFLDRDEADFTGIKYNNFWSEYDTGDVSVFAIGAHGQHISVPPLICTKTASDPDGLVIKGVGLNRGVSIGTETGKALGADKINADRSGINTRPTQSAAIPEHVPTTPTVSGSIPAIELSTSDVKPSDSHVIDLRAFNFTANSGINIDISGSDANKFALSTDIAHVDASGNANTRGITVSFAEQTTQGTYYAALDLTANNSDVSYTIPLTGTYTTTGPVAGGWTYGAFQQGEPDEVSTIIWTGKANDNDWNNRGNWKREDGKTLTCVDRLTEDLKVIIPSPKSEKYKEYISGSITKYPNIPAWNDIKNDDEAVRTATMYAKDFEIEYGAAIKGVENLYDGTNRRYGSTTAHLIVDRKDADGNNPNEWLLVGTVVKKFTNANKNAVRDLVSEDFYIKDHKPHVYMQHVVQSDDNIYPDVPFTDLDKSVTPQSAFQIMIPDQYGPLKIPAQYYYLYYETDDFMQLDGTRSKTFDFEGWFADEREIRTYTGLTTDGKYNFISNTYPANLNVSELVKDNTGLSAKVYNYRQRSWEAVTSVSNSIVLPQNGFAVYGSLSSVTPDADHYTDGSTSVADYKNADANTYAKLIVGNLLDNTGSTIYIIYDYPNSNKAFGYNISTPELYIIDTENNAKYDCFGIDDLSRIIPLGVRNKSSQSYPIYFKLEASEGLESVELEDRMNGEAYDLLSGSVPTFTGITANTDIEGRFYLNINYADPESQTTKVDENVTDSGIIDVFVNNNTVIVSSSDNCNLQTVTITDMAGRSFTYAANDDHYSKHKIPVESGVIIVTVVGENASKTEKFVIK